MKYYLLSQLPDKIEDRLWPVLKANEASIKELTKEEYEIHRGFRPARESNPGIKDVVKPVGAHTAQESGTSFSGENTKKEILEEISRIGIEVTSRLKQKTKAQLLEML